MPIISKNLDGVVTGWNKSAGRMFGYRAEEAIGQHITLIIPLDRRDEEEMAWTAQKRRAGPPPWRRAADPIRGHRHKSLDYLPIGDNRQFAEDRVYARGSGRGIGQHARAERVESSACSEARNSRGQDSNHEPTGPYALTIACGKGGCSCVRGQEPSEYGLAVDGMECRAERCF
jgi:PAS domain-containing protein